MCFIMIFDTTEYFAEYAVINENNLRYERKMSAFQQNSFIKVFTKNTCNHSEISAGADIPADRKLVTGTGPAVYRYRFHLCYTLFISHRRLRLLSYWYSCAFRSYILASELTSALQSVVGVALLRHSRLPAPTCTIQPAYYSSFKKHCKSCNIDTPGLSAHIS